MRHSLLFILPFVAMTANAQVISIAGNDIMKHGDFGLTTNMRSWDSQSRTSKVTEPKDIEEDYYMLTGKRSHCYNKGKERVYAITNAQKDTLFVRMRQFHDGYAFRYELKNMKEGEVIKDEGTRFHVPADANRWMQKHNGPGYENFYPLCKGGISPEGERITEWSYPALFELGKGQFMLISDSYSPENNCGTMLRNTAEDRNTYTVNQFSEIKPGNSSWHSGWHVLIAGTLADVVESTLITDVADPCQYSDPSWIEPGVSSWIYWAYNHGSQEYNILKEYVDLAVDMKWPYTLVDAEWDVMRGGTIEDVVKYAVSKGIKPMIWYNSTTNWVGPGAPSPQGKLNDPIDRDNEFAKIASWGVKGVKIDFFRDDTQETTDYYLALAKAAAKHHLTVNFHGGTIPHGWQRTYPNIVTCEGVYGAEWYNNLPVLTKKAAAHNATLPFTRNVIGPMDYTPGTFTDSQHPHITSHGHELALPFLFESGSQHMPDRPSAYRELPEQVKELLSSLPSTWDDTRLICGYPGDYVCLARLKGKTWYIAGINGTDTPRTITVDLNVLPKTATSGTLFADGKSQKEFSISKVKAQGGKIDVPCLERGGFVLKVQAK